MQEVSMYGLESKLASFEQRLDNSQTLIQILFERCIATEAVLATLLAKGNVDLDAVESLLLKERGGNKKADRRISEIIGELKARVASPDTPLKDD